MGKFGQGTLPPSASVLPLKCSLVWAGWELLQDRKSLLSGLSSPLCSQQRPCTRRVIQQGRQELAHPLRVSWPGYTTQLVMRTLEGLVSQPPFRPSVAKKGKGTASVVTSCQQSPGRNLSPPVPGALGCPEQPSLKSIVYSHGLGLTSGHCSPPPQTWLSLPRACCACSRCLGSEWASWTAGAPKEARTTTFDDEGLRQQPHLI